MDINQHKNATTIKELASVYHYLNSLVDNHQLKDIDALLKNVDIDNASTELLIGLARFTYRWRNNLDYWYEYTNRMSEQVRLRNIDERALIGLVDN